MHDNPRIYDNPTNTRSSLRTSTVVLLENQIAFGFKQKFAVSRLLQKLYGQAVKHGYGLTYGQKPPFFSLPGYEGFFTELQTLGGYLRSMNWNPLVDTTNTSMRPAWEAWAKENIVPQTYGLPGNQSFRSSMPPRTNLAFTTKPTDINNALAT